MDTNKSRVCCFFGHRKIYKSEILKLKLKNEIEKLIVAKSVDTFLFGSNSEFDELCYITVTELKKSYQEIKRIYVRSSFGEVNDSYLGYLLNKYEGTYQPEKIKRAGMASYVERNYEMIDNSDFCIVYYDKEYLPPTRKHNKRGLSYQPRSGTSIAYAYALKKKLEIINILDLI